MTTFSLLSKPMLTPEVYEASRSFLFYSSDTNALPSRLAGAVLKRSAENEAAVRDLAMANGDEILMILRPSAVATNVMGCNLCKPTLKELGIGVLEVFFAVAMCLAFGAICYMTYFLIGSNESLFIKTCGVVVVPIAFIAILQVLAETYKASIDIGRLLVGKGAFYSEEAFLMISNEVSAITQKGLIHSPVKKVFTPTFVSWSAVGATKLENGPNSSLLVIDNQGALLARLYCPATETMTSADILDLVRINSLNRSKIVS